MSRRLEKINQLIKEEVSNLILRNLDISREVMITVTNVQTASDLTQAKIGISVMPFLKAEKILKILNFQTFNIQKSLDKILKTKIVPKIKFELDNSQEKISKIERLFKKHGK